MDINLSAFQEPRGVMRVFQFIFAICSYATTTDYSGFVELICNDEGSQKHLYSYPFDLQFVLNYNCTQNKTGKVSVMGDLSSDARFFVATGVLAMLYTLAIAFIYIKFDQKYKSNSQWPLADFILTVIFAVLWLSSSAAWANGLTALKALTSQPVQNCSQCHLHASSLTSLHISVILGFLNFFLWASDLWFLYKETEWFQQKQGTIASSPTI